VLGTALYGQRNVEIKKFHQAGCRVGCQVEDTVIQKMKKSLGVWFYCIGKLNVFLNAHTSD